MTLHSLLQHRKIVWLKLRILIQQQQGIIETILTGKMSPKVISSGDTTIIRIVVIDDRSRLIPLIQRFWRIVINQHLTIPGMTQEGTPDICLMKISVIDDYDW